MNINLPPNFLEVHFFILRSIGPATSTSRSIVCDLLTDILFLCLPVLAFSIYYSLHREPVSNRNVENH